MSTFVFRGITGRGRGYGSRFYGGLDCLDYRIEALGVGDGDFTEHLSIQFDIRPLAAADELAVPYASLLAGGVQPDDPESSEFTFSSSSVLLSVDAGPYTGLFC